ncbi:Myelin regulatory factor [Frankliniella fusca]|uniref:Myelin regulatory factor n=1 Tax=Frankliniella fusca TaxID=407009 RepID=A0AAE1L5D4_9NEOP|nr:Myelin regulatory factor [Frankliniella fusca]
MEYGWHLAEEPPVVGEDRCRRLQDRNAFEGIENDAIDFGDLEKYINEDTVTYFDDTLVPSDVARAHAAVVAAAAAGEELGQQQQQPPPDSNKTFGVYVIPSHSLPESPPDSGSEPPYSPPDHGGQSPHQRLSAGRAHGLQDILIQPMFPVHQPLAGPGALPGPGPGPGPHLVDLPAGGGLGAGLPPGATHTLHLQGAGGEMILVQHPVVPAASLPPAVPSPSPVPGGAGQPAVVYPGLTAAAAADTNKKRKLSQDGRIHVKTEPGMVAGGCPCPDVLGGVLEGVLASPPPRVLTARSVPEMSPDPSSNQTGALEEDYGMDCDNPYADSSMQCIRFSAFEKENWHSLIDGNLGELVVVTPLALPPPLLGRSCAHEVLTPVLERVPSPAPSYQVVADKGFNFSNADDAFVCQKKNHFQITCHVRLHGDAQFVRATSSLQKILSWQLHFYGVKTEATAQTIKVEQSQSDRSKKAFHPVQVELRPDESVKKTVGRLHFSETTSNNMRKKGKPNPDQRYFYLVVGLHAHCADGNAYPVVAHHSERIIVRASNPGQFESDAELCWQKGSVSDSIYHTGKCGINTDRPEEALTVHGNLRITGHVIQPSDLRAKQAIQECDTKQQLRNVQQLRVVHYQYTDEFARHAGLPCTQNTGVIAQQVKAVLPEAVSSAGDVVLPSGARLDNFLVVNKDRLFMENIGAVQALVEVTGNLETRIDELERMNRRLDKMKRRDSLKSVASSVSMRHPRPSKTGSFTSFADGILCSNKLIQSTIVLMVLIIAFCLVAMATLYFLEFQKRNDNYDIPISRQTVIQTQTHPPTMSTPRPSKMRYKSGATPYSKKLTTIAPSLHKQQKAEREGVKAEREEGGGGRAEKATAAPQPPPPPPPPSSTRPPPPPPPPAQPLVLGSPPLCDTDQALCPCTP